MLGLVEGQIECVFRSFVFKKKTLRECRGMFIYCLEKKDVFSICCGDHLRIA